MYSYKLKNTTIHILSVSASYLVPVLCGSNWWRCDDIKRCNINNVPGGELYRDPHALHSEQGDFKPEIDACWLVSQTSDPNVYYSWVLYSSGTGTGDCGNHAKDVAEKSDNDHIIGKLIQPTIQPEDAADQSYSSNQSCNSWLRSRAAHDIFQTFGESSLPVKERSLYSIVSQKILKCVWMIATWISNMIDCNMN